MQRAYWAFIYTGEALAEAARIKISYHSESLEWWKAKKAEVTATIRSDGIEVDEKIALDYSNPTARDWDRGGEILARNDLRKQLAECFEKLADHSNSIDDYNAWLQALTANPEQTFDLDIQDWQFFFGRA